MDASTDKKRIIKHLTIRANTLAAMDKPLEDIYWQLKNGLFQAEKIWELEAPRYYWPIQIKRDISTLNMALDKAWCKMWD